MSLSRFAGKGSQVDRILSAPRGLTAAALYYVSSSSVTVTFPAGILAGDLLMIVSMIYNTSYPITGIPGGFTQRTTGTAQIHCWTMSAAGTESGTTFNVTTAAGYANALGVLVFQGYGYVDTGAYATHASGLSAATTAAAVTAGDIVVDAWQSSKTTADWDGDPTPAVKGWFPDTVNRADRWPGGLGVTVESGTTSPARTATKTAADTWATRKIILRAALT